MKRSEPDFSPLLSFFTIVEAIALLFFCGCTLAVFEEQSNAGPTTGLISDDMLFSAIVVTLLWWPLAFIFVVHAITALAFWIAKRPKFHNYKARRVMLSIAMLLVSVGFVSFETEIARNARFALSKGELSNTTTLSTAPRAPLNQRVGLYWVDELINTPEATILITAQSDPMTRHGFAVVPTGVTPASRRDGEEWTEFIHIDGPWYEYHQCSYDW